MFLRVKGFGVTAKPKIFHINEMTLFLGEHLPFLKEKLDSLALVFVSKGS